VKCSGRRTLTAIPTLTATLTFGCSDAASTPATPDAPEERRFEMYYTKSDETTVIGLATSDDGKLWTQRSQNTVLAPGDSGAWDEASVTDPCVIRVGNAYYLYYAGENAEGVEAIGFATSKDGKEWSKHPGNPVVEAGSSGSYDSDAVSNPMVLEADGVFSLWYTAVDDEGTETTGLARSTDGATWIKEMDVPALGVGEPGSFYERETSDPGVVLAQDQAYWLFFSAVDDTTSFDPQGRRTIGRAVSSDGAMWQAAEAPVFSPSSDTSAFDSLRVTSVEVEVVAEEYYLYYVGTSDDEDLPEGSILPDQSITQQTNVGGIGLAISADGLTWRRFSAPIVASHGAGATVADPSVLVLSD
jgi:predicted GH43/DUF377 family glycosyl hydrolase